MISLVLAAALLLVPTSSASGATTHCVGYSGCRAQGLSDSGYGAVNNRYYWNMALGHNCTAYAAYRMIQAGRPNSRPWSGSGDANRWGHEMAGITDGTPMVGAVAWWDAFRGGWGENGHVAYVERVTANTITISEDIYNGDFRWRTLTRGEAAWPTGFIHFADERVRAVRSPSVSGTPRVGEVLNASGGTWSPGDVALSYQWLLDGRPIKGATGSRLELTPSMLRKRVDVRVDASRIGYQAATATMRAARRVDLGVIDRRRAPRIIGSARVGEIVVADPGVWEPRVRARYQWFAGDRRIRDASGPRLRIGPELAGRRIHVRLTLRAPGYRPAKARVAVPRPVGRGALERRVSPRILGTPQVGQTLTAQPGGWSVEPAKRAYVWFVDDQVVEGQYGPQLLVDAAMVGRAIVVVEGVARPGYAPGVSASRPVGPVVEAS
ncbi:CHAP domain-containing protein [Nocardioides sp. R-C-SC26]|uniref:CHAP domain-containing protein n=1 Tax=Nocardioides sp. R-C-SC26 TaxID=2870414 RepID=UPI001E3A5C05|nr:CHAP domain-containing protein [Nocardioides sp. R-C-SC26]